MGTEVVEGPITSSSSLLPLFVAEIGIVVIPIIPRRCRSTFRRSSSRYSPPKRAESWRETKGKGGKGRSGGRESGRRWGSEATIPKGGGWKRVRGGKKGWLCIGRSKGRKTTPDARKRVDEDYSPSLQMALRVRAF